MLMASHSSSPPRDVLIVDDDALIRESVSVMLQEEGYEVRTAANGDEALDVLRSTEAPGLILLDLTMPVMDGNTLLAVLDNDPRLAAIPVVIISAMAHRAPKERPKVLSKPLNFEEVLSIVVHHCGPAFRAA
jgi:CheY-like chemotaxis protein